MKIANTVRSLKKKMLIHIAVITALLQAKIEILLETLPGSFERSFSFMNKLGLKCLRLYKFDRSVAYFLGRIPSSVTSIDKFRLGFLPVLAFDTLQN